MPRRIFKSLRWVFALVIGLALLTGIQNGSPKPSVATLITAASEKFRNKDVAHADFYDDMVATYSGPNVTDLPLPYGIPQNDFKFAYEIGELKKWRRSYSPTATTYGERPIHADEMRLWYESILNYELPASVEGPDYQGAKITAAPVNDTTSHPPR